jgi:hypothetical protein
MAMNRTIAKAEKIFLKALEQEPTRRPAFVEAACGNNHALRKEVNSLLRAHDQAGDFLARRRVLPEKGSIPE